MTVFVVKRVCWSALLLVAVSLSTFLLFYALPLDPARAACAKNCTPGIIAANRRALHLDKPLWTRFGYFADGLVHGNLGFSVVQQRSVGSILASGMPVTASIAFCAFVLWVSVGVGGGVIAAVFRGSWIDRLVVAASLITYSVPSFFVGLVLLTFVAIKWAIVPLPQYVSPFDNPLLWAEGMILPAITVAGVFVASYVRLTRSTMVDALSEDFMTTARAKGVSRWTAIWRHAFRTALTPIVTAAGLDLGALLGGAVVSEQVFNLNGVGRQALTAINSFDLPTIAGTVLVAATFVISANLIVDLLYAVIDPRVAVGAR